MSKNILKQSEKNEITNDVKKAFKKAKEKNIKGSNKRAIMLSVIIIIVVFASCLYFFLNNNPKNIFVNNINSIYNLITKNISSDEIFTLKINFDNNDITYTKNNKKGIVNITNDNKELYIKQNKVYLIKQEKASLIGDDIYNLSADNNYILTCLEQFKLAFIKAIDGKKVYGSKESTLINGKNFNVYLISFDINDSFKETLKNELLNDSKFIDAYRNVRNISKADAQSDLQNLIIKMPKKISIYTGLIYHDVLKITLDDIEITKVSTDDYNIKGNNNINIKLDNGILITTEKHRIEIKNDKTRKIVHYNTDSTETVDYNITNFFN